MRSSTGEWQAVVALRTTTSYLLLFLYFFYLVLRWFFSGLSVVFFWMLFCELTKGKRLFWGGSFLASMASTRGVVHHGVDSPYYGAD